jgi:hypothetical protein
MDAPCGALAEMGLWGQTLRLPPRKARLATSRALPRALIAEFEAQPGHGDVNHVGLDLDGNVTDDIVNRE